jgi:hypothetical protein
MWYCYDCEEEFEAPVVVTQQRAGEPSFDEEVCPSCGYDNIYDIDSGDDDRGGAYA